jgi:hypothetical protein
MTTSFLQKRFVAPALPTAPSDYDQRRDDQLNYSLRLYFNNLDTYLASLSGPIGGGVLGIPHIAASDSTNQYATASDTPTIVKFNTLDSGNAFTLNAPGSATCQMSGVYTIRYSAQIVNTVTNAAHQATFWLKVNNDDVINSATTFSIQAAKSNSIPTFICAYSEITFTVNAGDEIELYWATDQAHVPSPLTRGVYIFAEAAWTTPTNPYARPAIPSVIGSITFVSALTT